MTHIIAGYPTIQESEAIAIEMAKSGADFIEIQIPFSDPLADGPIIMQANKIALDQGVNCEKSFDLMRKIKQKVSIPLLFMTYFNIVFRYGIEQFCAQAAKSHAYGIIIPDLPFEESDQYVKACNRYNLNPIFVVAPNTPSIRLQEIAKKAKGFIYCMARYGVTGSRTEFSNHLNTYLQRVKKICQLPIAVGFGIHSKEQIQKLEHKADIAVIGSALLKKILEAKSSKNVTTIVSRFIKNLGFRS